MPEGHRGQRGGWAVVRDDGLQGAAVWRLLGGAQPEEDAVAEEHFERGRSGTRRRVHGAVLLEA
jgi:hypothetical protein